ncbi:MAG: EAL domain-containing protein [Candidatus Thiodiazotropha sp.]
MRLNRKILFITIGLLAVSLLISSLVNILGFKSRYAHALLTGSFGVAHSIESVITESLSLGLSLHSLSNLDGKLAAVVAKNSYIAYAGVADAQATMLFHSDSVLRGSQLTDPVTIKVLSVRKPIWQLFHRFDGKLYYDVAVPLFDSNAHFIGAIRLGFRSSVVDDEVKKAAIQILVNFAITFLVVVFLLNLFLRRSIIEPIEKLSDYAGAINNGRFDQIASIKNRDEIGGLARSLQEMGKTLKVQIKALKHARQELEEHINVRTYELARTNRNLLANNRDLKEALVREKELTDVLRVSEEKFRIQFEKNKAVMLAVDPKNGQILAANDAAVNFYGYSHDVLMTMNINDINTLSEHEIALEMELANHQKRGHFYFRHTLANGEVRDVEVHSGPIDWSGQRVLYSIIHDITDRKKAEAELERIAHFDSLTGLPNRLLKSDRLHQAISRAKRNKTRVAICYLDLDGFKPVNDKYGHDIGDLVLIETGHRLQKTVREGDTVSRIGGDEFVLILPELFSLVACEFILKRVMDAINMPFSIQGKVIKVSASIGFTLYPEDNVEADILLRHADQAMYVAKAKGKNCFHLFDSEQDREAKSHREGYQRLQQALLDDEFVLYYQPKVNMYTCQMIGAEALIRWQHPDEGLLPPGAFLHNVIDSELEILLGNWVIDQALRQLNDWQQQGLNLSVSVNVSPYYLQYHDFFEHICGAISKYPDLNPSNLELEILETASIEDLSYVIKTLVSCQEFGIQIALDNLSTSYASLTYLHRLPVDILKIDQGFVSDMLENPQDLAIVDSVVKMSQAYHHPVIAKGVESLEHGSALLRLGCQLGQGYGIAHPMPAENLPAWLEAWQLDSSWHNLKLRLEQANYSDVKAAIASHHQWLKRTVAILSEPVASSQLFLLDSHNCSFGRWFQVAGYFQYGHLKGYATIRECHERIHLLSQELYNQLSVGHRENVLSRLDELHDIHKQFIESLEDLIQLNLDSKLNN